MSVYYIDEDTGTIKGPAFGFELIKIDTETGEPESDAREFKDYYDEGRI